jgi:hypothetical protein
MSTELASAASARLLINFLNNRFGAAFAPPVVAGEAFTSTDGGHSLAIYVAPLWEENASWDAHLAKMENRLSSGGGSFLLWVPPRATVPSEEPDASFFVQRVQAGVSALPEDARMEVTFPVTLKLAKMREEGGYASVIGGLNRWWTRITENVNGTFHVDSTAVHRLTLDGEARERLWSDIGSLSHSIDVGQAADFEIDDSWTLQRLHNSESYSGVAIIGAPPNIDATDGIFVRRNVRKRLAAANEALGALDVDLRVVGLIGSYEYGELETAGATIKAVDSALFNRLEVVSILADGEVRPTFLPKTLPWA